MVSPLEAERLTVDMKHPDSPSGYYMNAGSGYLDDPNVKPSDFKLPTTPVKYVEVEEVQGGRLYDFGKETFGFIKFHNLSGSGRIKLQYGETSNEALDNELV